MAVMSWGPPCAHKTGNLGRSRADWQLFLQGGIFRALGPTQTLQWIDLPLPHLQWSEHGVTSMRFGGRGRLHAFSMKMVSKLLRYPPPTVQRWMRTCCQSGSKPNSPRPMCQTKRAALGKASNANQEQDEEIDISQKTVLDKILRNS